MPSTINNVDVIKIMVDKENEREALEREYRRLDMLESRRYSYRAPKTNPIGYIVLAGGFFITCLSILAMFFHKSDKDKCKC